MWTRDALVQQRKKTITVDGDDMVIRALTAAEAVELTGTDLRSKEIFGIISMSIVDPELSPEDIGLLPTSVVTEITTEIFEFNKLGPKAIEDAKNELKKTQAVG